MRFQHLYLITILFTGVIAFRGPQRSYEKSRVDLLSIDAPVRCFKTGRLGGTTRNERYLDPVKLWSLERDRFTIPPKIDPQGDSRAVHGEAARRQGFPCSSFVMESGSNFAHCTSTTCRDCLLISDKRVPLYST